MKGEALAEGPLPPGGAEGARAATASLGQWALGRPSLYGLPSALPWLALGETTYKDPLPVRTMPAFSAALALATAEASAAAVAGRRERARDLEALLDSKGMRGSVRRARPMEGGEGSYLRFPVLCSKESRTRFASKEARCLGIQPGYPIPLPELPAVQGLRRDGTAPYPGAQELCRSLVTLPTHALLRERDLAKISAAFASTPSSGN